jgi:hypothetical protein
MFPDMHIFREVRLTMEPARKSNARTDMVISAGRTFFSVGLIGIGAQDFYFGHFIPVVAGTFPETGSENGRRNSGLMQILNSMIRFGLFPLAVMVLMFGVHRFNQNQPAFSCAEGK